MIQIGDVVAYVTRDIHGDQDIVAEVVGITVDGKKCHLSTRPGGVSLLIPVEWLTVIKTVWADTGEPAKKKGPVMVDCLTVAAPKAEPPNEKIQLRLTRSALERLIAGEPQLEVLLSHAAVKEVLNDHLTNVKKMIDLAAEEAMGRYDAGAKKFHLSGPVNRAVSEWAQKLVETQVGNYLRNQAAEIRQSVDEATAKQLAPAVTQAVEAAKNRLLRKLSEG